MNSAKQSERILETLAGLFLDCEEKSQRDLPMARILHSHFKDEYRKGRLALGDISKEEFASRYQKKIIELREKRNAESERQRQAREQAEKAVETEPSEWQREHDRRQEIEVARQGLNADIVELAKSFRCIKASFDWGNSDFDLRKAACLSIIAELAYCMNPKDRAERNIRAKIVPCSLYERAINIPEVSANERLRLLEFTPSHVFETQHFVSLIVQDGADFLVGVRGTQFAYDWFINFKAYKRTATGGGEQINIHHGFFAEAQELMRYLDRFFDDAVEGPRRNLNVWICGHSLGGAVAAIVQHIASVEQSVPIRGCYTFAAPRIASVDVQQRMPRPFATRRPLDKVPYMPPRSFGYGDYLDERTTAGEAFKSFLEREPSRFIPWVASLALNRLLKDHSIETYRAELISAVKHRYAELQTCG